MKEKYSVGFYGGIAKDGEHGCNYMHADVQDQDGDDVELYAEYLAPDEWAGREQIPAEEMNAFDDESFEPLKAEIISQAKEYGISEDQLDF